MQTNLSNLSIRPRRPLRLNSRREIPLTLIVFMLTLYLGKKLLNYAPWPRANYEYEVFQVLYCWKHVILWTRDFDVPVTLQIPLYKST